MSSFTEEWLALREPHDRMARNTALLNRLRAWREDRKALAVLDLGAGTGSTLRAITQALGGNQHWTLVEQDPALLGLIRERCRHWAEREGLAITDDGEEGFRVAWPGGEARVRLLRSDLAQNLDRLPWPQGGVVTASALLDLVSRRWLVALADHCRRVKIACYAALTVDGRIAWSPGAAEDREIDALVRRHQERDKGFGPALGPRAVSAAEESFTERGFEVLSGCSDWRIAAPEHAALLEAFLQDWAEAAQAMSEEPTRIEAWRARRQAMLAVSRGGLMVGHRDLLALPAS